MMLLTVSFSVSNDTIISLSLWPLKHQLELPIWMFGVTAFTTGGVLGSFIMWGYSLAIRTKLWKSNLKIKKLETQSDVLVKIDSK